MSNDGGQAFPRPTKILKSHFGTEDEIESYEGMTLRDYFGAMALSGMITNGLELAKEGNDIDDKMISKMCYAIADAMIAERGKDV